MKKGTRADRRLKREQKRGIVTMGRVGHGKSYFVDVFGRKRQLEDRPRENVYPAGGHITFSLLLDPVSVVVDFFGLVYSLDPKQAPVPESHRVNPPGTMDLVKREDGVYE